jgi:hypothetical protein
VAATGSWRWVARCCPVTRQANCSLTPSRAAGDERLAAGVPGRDVSIRDLLERDFLQFRISQKPLERGVFTLEVFEPLDVLPPDRMAACPARRTESICGESPLRRSSARPGLVTRQPRRQSSGRAHTAFQWPVESKRYCRWKVCRTRDERPISGGEYSPSGHEQLGRQPRYSSVTI